VLPGRPASAALPTSKKGEGELLQARQMAPRGSRRLPPWAFRL